MIIKFKKHYKHLNVIKDKGFEFAVSTYSISSTKDRNGRLGWIEETQLSKKYIEKVTKMKIGNISEPIKNSDSVIILKLK